MFTNKDCGRKRMGHTRETENKAYIQTNKHMNTGKEKEKINSKKGENERPNKREYKPIAEKASKQTNARTSKRRNNKHAWKRESKEELRSSRLQMYTVQTHWLISLVVNTHTHTHIHIVLVVLRTFHFISR